MRTFLSYLAAGAILTVMVTGCAGPEQKAGRGLRNVYEIVRGGDFRRSVEQTAVYETPDVAYTTGAIKGFNKSITRTFVGVYELVTFPLPPYDPVLTNYIPAHPVYPDSYEPNLIADSIFATDTSLGFAGGDVAPMVPGSRFRIFDN